MKKICPACRKEKESARPKLIKRSKSGNKRLVSQDDVLITTIMCDDCYNKNKKEK
jgi:hypothetical protein